MDKQTLINQLKNLTVAATTVFSQKFAHGACRCELTAVERLAAVFTHIAFEAKNSTALTPDQLKAVGEDLEQRLHYLMEPIAPIEIDGEGAVLQMRSVPPTEEEGKGHSYYELLVRSDQLALCRYTTANQSRTKTSMTITHEVFGRLMVDFAEAHAAAMSNSP